MQYLPKTTGGWWWAGILCIAACVCSATFDTARGAEEDSPYISPTDVRFSPDGKQLLAVDRTGGAAFLIDAAKGVILRRIALEGAPAAAAWSADGSRCWVSETGAWTVAEIDPAAGKVLRRFKVGIRPRGLEPVKARGILLVADSALDAVSVIDLAGGEETRRIPVTRDPFAVAATPDGKLAVVSNLLPAGAATRPDHGAVVSFLDLEKLAPAGEVALPPGSTSVRGVELSPDGKWAYVAHTVGRMHLPTTQLERGWVNTNALSIIDVAGKKLRATVLLDHPMQGVADPWGVAVSADGKRLWVSTAGTHQYVAVDLAGLHELVEKSDDKAREELVNDLAALYRGDLAERVRVEGDGIRGIDVSPDGSRIAAAMYFSGTIAIYDTEKNRAVANVSLGKNPEPTLARRGDMIFHDATYCFQHWLSCGTCHPNDGRVDALNWDLLNDGLGNPKNNRSLLWAQKTPPMMSRGVRETMDQAVEAGFLHILFRQPEAPDLDAVRAYIRSLEPEPSPHRLPDGSLSQSAERGEEIFLRKSVGCARCHPPPLYTDLKSHNVHTKGMYDRASRFDTPTLVEAYRTAPYLHDGSAASVRDVITGHNEEDRHGKTSELTPKEIEDLVAYLLSL